jgi:hypothetical protein
MQASSSFFLFRISLCVVEDASLKRNRLVVLHQDCAYRIITGVSDDLERQLGVRQR